jgi:hypothetical protein
MPKIRALTSWADRQAGEEWDASYTDAALLCTPDLPGGQKAEYVDRAMTAAEPQQTKTDSPPAQGQPEKRRYQRRDLRATE